MSSGATSDGNSKTVICEGSSSSSSGLAISAYSAGYFAGSSAGGGARIVVNGNEECRWNCGDDTCQSRGQSSNVNGGSRGLNMAVINADGTSATGTCGNDVWSSSNSAPTAA